MKEKTLDLDIAHCSWCRTQLQTRKKLIKKAVEFWTRDIGYSMLLCGRCERTLRRFLSK